MDVRLEVLVVAFLLVLSRCDVQKQAPSVVTAKLSGEMDEFIWCGAANEAILIKTVNNAVYRSNNRGVSFKLINKHMWKAASVLAETQSEMGEVTNVIRSEADDKTLLFVGNKGLMWVTTDCGETLKAITADVSLASIKLHPTEKTWMLGAGVKECSDPDDETCIAGGHTLYLTQDLGTSWRAIAQDVPHFEWAFNEGQIKAGIPVTRIFALQFRKPQYVVVRTDDFFGNTTTIATQCVDFKLRANYLFIEQHGTQSDINLYVGNIEDKFNKLYKALFPFPVLKLHQYHILDTAEQVVFLLVTHSLNSPFGHLYVSDSTGVRFALSLKHCVIDPRHGADFYSVSGQEGVFIANAIDDKSAEEFEMQAEEETQEEEDWEEQEREWSRTRSTQQSGRRKKLPMRVWRNNIHTFITFNKGGAWRYLQAPKTDANNKPIHCSGNAECALHLTIHRDTTVPLYSHKNAHGLILALGSVGRTLQQKYEQRNVYLSRDGGLSWLEIAKGPHVYDMADHGAILVKSKLGVTGKRFSAIDYSWNEGLTWSTMKLELANATIEDVFTEPDSSTQYFLVRADTYESNEEEDSPTKTTHIYSLNFEGLHTRMCKGEGAVGTSDSDFEYWTPYDGRHGKACLLGRKITYVRRKRETECYNGINFERPLFAENCECTEEDYECDFGFSRKDLQSNSPCLPITNISYAPPPQCPSGGSYIVSAGYRKVAGDSCVGGVLHDAIKIPCPVSSLFAGPSLIIIVLLAIIVVLLVVIGYSYQNFEAIQDKLQSVMQGTGRRSGRQPPASHLKDVKYGKIEEKVDEGDEEVVIQTAPAVPDSKKQ